MVPFECSLWTTYSFVNGRYCNSYIGILHHIKRAPGWDSGGSASHSKGFASYLGFEKILPQRTFRNGTGMRPVLS